MPSELALSTPRSPCLRSDTPLDSCHQSYTPPNSPRVHAPPQDETLDRFEQAVKRLAQVLGKVEATNKCEDATPGVTKDIEAEKPKTRASKMEYKLVDKMYVTYPAAVPLPTFYRTVGIGMHPNTKSRSRRRQRR